MRSIPNRSIHREFRKYGDHELVYVSTVEGKFGKFINERVVEAIDLTEPVGVFQFTIRDWENLELIEK